MQEKLPFSSYFDFFSNVWEGDTPSHSHPLRTLILTSGTPLPDAFKAIIPVTLKKSLILLPCCKSSRVC